MTNKSQAMYYLIPACVVPSEGIAWVVECVVPSEGVAWVVVLSHCL